MKSLLAELNMRYFNSANGYRNNNRQRDEDGGHERNGKFIRLPCQSERYNISLHYTRRTGRDGEIPVSWILRKLSDAFCKVAAETVR